MCLVALMVQMVEAGAGMSVRGFLGFHEILVLRDAQGPGKRDGFHPALCPSSASCGLTFGRLLCWGMEGAVDWESPETWVLVLVRLTCTGNTGDQ